MNISSRQIGRLMQQGHRNFMKTLQRHSAGPLVAAIVMEAYSEFLDGDFKKQMTEKYKVEYPLNIERTISKKEAEKCQPR